MTVDVAARLAEGRPSVSNTASYVSACRAVGYQHPDLTAHGAQMVEWYSGEDGLDLHALDADCATLRAAALSADDALQVIRDGQAAVLAGWQGDSGSVAVEFIGRHCSSGASVVQALNVAASACEALRDSVGRLVDEKVGAAISIDDRRAGERPAWLAAAATVTSGGAARDEAVAVVTLQITPYVDTDIRTEWIAAMRSATAAVAAAYEDALRQLNAIPATYFEVPGQFGTPPASAPAAALAAPTVPAAALPAAPAPPPLPDTAAAQPVPPALAPEPPAALGAPPSTGMPAMPDVGGGLSGLVGQIADALGGLFDGMPDNTAEDDLPEPDDPFEEELEPEDPEPTEDPVPEDVPAAEDPPAEEPVVTEAEPVETPPAPPQPEPQPEPLAAEQPERLEQPEQSEQTPCEIAADELAQVGQ